MAGNDNFVIDRRQFILGASAALAAGSFSLIPTSFAEAKSIGGIAVGGRPSAVAAQPSARLRFTERPMPIPPGSLSGGAAKLQELSEEAFSLIRLPEANEQFPGIDGSGMAAAVIDTGVRPTHQMFVLQGDSRIIKERNFSSENGGWADDAWDTHGHGSHVAGLIAGRELVVGGFSSGGVAPGAGLVSVKILDRNGTGDLAALARSLVWLRRWNGANGRTVTAVNLSLGDPGNYVSEADALRRNQIFRTISREIDRMIRQDVVVVCAAGNAYHYYQAEGLAFPAIMRQTVSVGAVFDSDLGPYTHPSGLWSANAAANKIVPYSQRLSLANPGGTAVFAPGTHLISASHLSDTGLSTLQGTSQSAPIVTGAVLRAQQLYKSITNRLPAPADVRSWLVQSMTTLDDGDDSVQNTGKHFPVLDLPQFLRTAEIAARLP
ncbi:S8 family serine peptidase [Aquibium sp. LZ166]|uniref:S8 family serine peptidase n=1 Tax=Aquibium pacificus TaxID=3153579 RepID=A0ABV3SJ52_9HYPH